MMNDRMREEIDNMMQNITFDPAMMQRTRTKSRKHSITHAAKRAIALAVAAAILTTGAFALGVSLLQHIRNQMGSFGSQVMPIAATCQTEDEGFEFSVVASLCDGYQSSVFVAVKDTIGGRLDENTEMYYYMEDTTGRTGEKIPEWKYADSTIGNLPLSYDEKTHTAIYEVRQHHTNETLPEANRARTFQIIVEGFQNGIQDRGLLSDGDNGAHIQLTGIADTVLQMNGEMPVPGQNPQEIKEFDGIKISSVGFDSEGIFHTLFEIPENIYIGNTTRFREHRGYLDVFFADPEYVFTPAPPYSENRGVLKQIWSDDGRWYDCKYYGADKTKMPQTITLDISGLYKTEPMIEVEAKMEPTVQPSPVFIINDPIDLGTGVMTEQIMLSPLGLYIVSPISYNGDTDPTTAIITMKDGTIYAYGSMEQRNAGINDRSHVWWDFSMEVFWDRELCMAKPLDLTQVDKVTINGVEIPFDR